MQWSCCQRTPKLAQLVSQAHKRRRFKQTLGRLEHHVFSSEQCHTAIPTEKQTQMVIWLRYKSNSVIMLPIHSLYVEANQQAN